jgi:nucleoside-diphosphate-sugar epimerase
VFVTGASGFVGSRLLRALAQAGAPDVRLLLRNPGSVAGLPESWRVVPGPLAEPEAWSDALRGVESVIHLAAVTGKAPRRLQHQISVEGTRLLVRAAERAGVRRFLYVSTIAVSYAKRPHYHYAEAKAAAEAVVAGSSLDWLIVRPTMVLGSGSPNLASLERLALLPVPVVFGDGTVPVQPIHVDDLAALLAGALGAGPWGRRTLAVGGPESLSLNELLGRIRESRRRPPRRLRHLPVAPFRAALALLEPVLLPLLPFTAGQLAFFCNASRAEPDPFLARLPPAARGLGAMLAAPA